MAKRHKSSTRGRGATRGRGGRGGGRFRSTSAKSRGQGAQNGRAKGARTPHDVPELMDLSQGSFLPEANSMRGAARRPRSLMGEALYTDKNMPTTMRTPLRNRPIEFVRAKEVYDPNEELRKQLEDVALKEKVVQDTHSSDDISVGDLEAEEYAEEEEKDSLRTSQQGIPAQTDPDGEPRHVEATTAVEAAKPEKKSSEEIEFTIDEEGDFSVPREPKMSAALLGHHEPTQSENLEHDSVITIGNVTLQTSTDENGQMTTDLMSIQSLNKLAKPGFVNERAFEDGSSGEDSADEFDSDPSGYRDYISQIMQQMREDSDYDGSEYESDTNFDIMAEDSSSDDEADEASQEEEEQDNADPEYGFLDEDYGFDISRITISNARLGIHNQYYTKCIDLNTNPDEFEWIDEGEIKEYVLQSGVKEHRLKSFMKFLTKGIIDDEDVTQPDYSDVYISETSVEEEEEDEDNLRDLVAFANSTNRPNDFDIDFEGNKTLQTKGKGRKKQLDLDQFDMDMDLRESLFQQYVTQRESKKARKQRHDDEKMENGLSKYDLFIKYPYTLHIKDIREEMESFLHNPSRDRMRFPPLDPHGNKTVGKMADCYNFKSKRVGGNGLKAHMEVVKTKRTFHYLPRYDQIGSIVRQRPIFHRIDQKRPKDEIVDLDGNKKKDKARGRNKEVSGAHVKEGDIVGEKAPEIAVNNIGRQLLIKMGWTGGEGLGAHGNKGISEPVLAKVKNSKLGLR